MAPAAINDQVREAIVATRGLAVHLEAGFGLRRGGCSGALLKTSAFRTGGQACHIRLGDGGEAKHQKG